MVGKQGIIILHHLLISSKHIFKPAAPCVWASTTVFRNPLGFPTGADPFWPCYFSSWEQKQEMFRGWNVIATDICLHSGREKFHHRITTVTLLQSARRVRDKDTVTSRADQLLPASGIYFAQNFGLLQSVRIFLFLNWLFGIFYSRLRLDRVAKMVLSFL